MPCLKRMLSRRSDLTCSLRFASRGPELAIVRVFARAAIRKRTRGEGRPTRVVEARSRRTWMDEQTLPAPKPQGGDSAAYAKGSSSRIAVYQQVIGILQEENSCSIQPSDIRAWADTGRAFAAKIVDEFRAHGRPLRYCRRNRREFVVRAPTRPAQETVLVGHPRSPHCRRRIA